MNIDLNDAIVRLNPDNNVQMNDACGACIHVHWGDLWITQEGDLKDHIVKTGESFAINRSGTTILNAMNESGVSVMEKCSESAIAAAAGIGNVISTTLNAAESGAVEYEVSADDSGFDALGPGDRQPGGDEVAQILARAKQYRARFFRDMISRVWNALRRSSRLVREFG